MSSRSMHVRWYLNFGASAKLCVADDIARAEPELARVREATEGALIIERILSSKGTERSE